MQITETLHILKTYAGNILFKISTIKPDKTHIMSVTQLSNVNTFFSGLNKVTWVQVFQLFPSEPEIEFAVESKTNFACLELVSAAVVVAQSWF